ncbi:hypothetical protein AAVH_33643 [Aphelenchoides avenae]|nr:hypothetical protein AAVH_33643 [Aphelenchus avenae]
MLRAAVALLLPLAAAVGGDFFGFSGNPLTVYRQVPWRLPTEGQSDLLCFQEIGYDGFGVSYTLKSSGGAKNYPCEVRFPGHTEVVIEKIDRMDEQTFVQLEAGNELDETRPVSARINTTSTEEPLNVPCRHAYLLFYSRVPGETVTFRIQSRSGADEGSFFASDDFYCASYGPRYRPF